MLENRGMFMKKIIKKIEKIVKVEKKEAKEAVNELTPGYNDLVSRARKVGLPDNATKVQIEAEESNRAVKLPADYPNR